MPEVIINNVPVDFPFEPYDVQTVYMEKIIECLQKGVNGVLESPTGTGKTLCLLCASLAWLRLEKTKLKTHASQDITKNLHASVGLLQGAEISWSVPTPKIIYASRTHTQLSQAVNELKRTNYAQTMRSAVLGSRDQFCIHPEVSKEQNNSNKIHMCQRYVAARSCMFYNNVETRKEHPAFTQSGILDIEDLVSASKKQRCCPYFMARELKNNADIIFMPYNYLVDPKARKANNIELDRCIIILDEAHNIEKMCEESASLQFRSTDIALCIDEVTKVMKDLVVHNETNGFSVEGLSAAVKDFQAEDLLVLKTMFLELEQAVDEIEVRAEGTTYPGIFMFELLSKAKLTPGNRNIVVETVDKMVQYLSASATSAFSRQGAGLQRFSELLTVVFNQEHRSLVRSVEACYKVHVTYEETKNKKQKSDWLSKTTDNNRGRVINYWCFSSSFGMQLLSQQGARCILLTSGTLSPITALVSELGINIPVTLENGHVITGEQVFVSVVPSGPDGTSLNSSYNTRNDPKYIASLGRTIQNFSRIVPGGLLVFFPSYPVLKKCQDEWQATGIWPKISENKAIFVETQTKEAFSNSMADYYNKIQCNSGACFLAVCRGKVSEGLDFSDNNGRAVIITGLPYPPLKDPRVVLKQSYLDTNKQKDAKGLSGQQWYQLEASRAVNQAIGRVIRHRNDFGAILLCDSRFANPNFKQQLSAWLQPHVQSFSNFGGAYKGLIDFFKKAEPSLQNCQTSRVVSRRPAGSQGDALRPAAASFDQARSRMVVRAAPAAAAPPCLSTSQISENVLSNSFGSPTGLSPSPLHSRPPKRRAEPAENLLSALNNACSNKVINFNEPSNTELRLPEFSRGSQQGSVSKRKLVLSSSKLKTEAGPSKPASDSKQEDIAAYWRRVKQSLQADEYKLFIITVKSYTKESNFDNLLTVLTKLFQTDNKQPELFSGFARFLKAEHKERFKKNCNK